MRSGNSELAKTGLAILKEFARETSELRQPPEMGVPSPTERVLPISVIRGTRSSLETITHQLNGSYEQGWYDACAVMMRKLIEALIVELFEVRGMAAKIKTPSGDFMQLEALIGKVIGEPSWTVSRTTKQALSNVKKVSDNSAHGRRFAAHRGDIDGLRVEFRAAVQELVQLCGWV